MSITNYLKYLIAFFALASDNILWTMIIAFVYGIGSYLIGLIWFHYGFVKAETEVFNNNNLFVKEMRKQIKSRKI